MSNLIEDSDLGLPLSTKFEKSLAKMIKRVVGIDRLNDLYHSLDPTLSTEQFVYRSAAFLGVECAVDATMPAKIPSQGAVVVVCNYPHGGVDGLVMLSALLAYRSDTKIMGGSILQKIRPLGDHIIVVDQAESSSMATFKGLREARRHLNDGGLLVVFPAQSVATYQRGFMDFTDGEWSGPLIKFMASTGAMIVPAYISGKNSLMFHLLSKFHHRLSEIRLVRELFNKQGHTVCVDFGLSMSHNLLSTLSSLDEWQRVICANITLLQTIARERMRETSQMREDDLSLLRSKRRSKPISVSLWPDKQELIADQVAALPHAMRLLSQGDYELYLAPVDRLSVVADYLNLIDEARFESMGYKFKAEDDPHSHLLFCWDRVQGRVAAAVKVGYGDQIFDAKGIDGFYCSRDFEFSHKFLPQLRVSIEVGEWIVVDHYADYFEPKWLLWRGEMSALMRSERYDYLLSMVRVCSSGSVTARRLIVNHLMEHFYRSDFQKHIVARHPLRSLSAPMFDSQTMRTLNRRELMESFIADADPAIDPLPPMLKRYVQVGGQAVALCQGKGVDKDSIYALAMVDVTRLKDGDMRLFHVEQSTLKF